MVPSLLHVVNYLLYKKKGKAQGEYACGSVSTFDETRIQRTTSYY